MRIILAEDDPSTNLILKKKLEKLDFEVEPYSDGKEAWEAIQTKDIPEIALIDWEMPHMDITAKFM